MLGSVPAHEVRVGELADALGTPLYLYDLDRLTARAREIRSAMRDAGVLLYFATMANDRPPVLRHLANLGLGACVNSLPHLELAAAAGFATDVTQFTSTGVTLDDMRVLLSRGVRLNADSLSQLRQWFELGGREAGLRLNSAATFASRHVDRIGVEPSLIPDAQAMARRYGAALTGIHIYAGTNYQSAADLLPTLAAFFKVAEKTVGLQYVNIGGGIGVDYAHAGSGFDLSLFGNALRTYAASLRTQHKKPIEIIFEPGRGLVASAGILVTRVTDVKVLHQTRYVSVDASIAVFPRPLLHPESPHQITMLGPKADTECGRAIVVGRTTFSKDILGTADLPETLQPGDLLAIEDAGAYSQSMSSRFLGQPAPAEFYHCRSEMGGVANVNSRQRCVQRPIAS